MLVYAIIPARSGSKGLPDKNIRELAGKPLVAYSIEFAQEIKGVDRVFCTTDSEIYREIAIAYGAEVPFLRSTYASRDTAMEQDILKDLRKSFKASGIPEPDIVVWLRPTFVFRSRKDVNECLDLIKGEPLVTAVRTVVSSENRLYKLSGNKLTPTFYDDGKSMIRRQDMPEYFKVFSTDVFRFKGNDFSDAFLGNEIRAIASHKICGLDIDDLIDFNIVKSLVENNRELVNEFLPTSCSRNKK